MRKPLFIMLAFENGSSRKERTLTISLLINLTNQFEQLKEWVWLSLIWGVGKKNFIPYLSLMD